MKIIRKEDHVFSVDIEKTKEYYSTHTLCECPYCRNYYTQIKNRLPQLTAFLMDFGVDVSRPDEIMSVESDGCISYINVDYTVCGNVDTMGEYELDLHDELFLSIIVTDGFASPNEQPEKYFTLSVTQIQLPWVLDEPFPQPITEKCIATTKGFFKNWFKKGSP